MILYKNNNIKIYVQFRLLYKTVIKINNNRTINFTYYVFKTILFSFCMTRI